MPMLEAVRTADVVVTVTGNTSIVRREHFEAIQGFHAGVRKSGIGGTDGKHGLYEYTHTQVAYIQT